MRIGALAHNLGVPVPTLRRWTQEFAEALTPEAQGGDGRPREFSVRDQRVLRRAHELLADPETTYAQVRRRLREEGLTAAPAPVAEELPDGPGPASEGEREAAERFVAAVVERLAASWIGRIDQLEREIGSLREQIAAMQEAAVTGDPATNATRRRWPFG